MPRHEEPGPVDSGPDFDEIESVLREPSHDRIGESSVARETPQEYASAGLDELIRDRGPMSAMQAVDCLIQAARAFEAAHARGMIHGNINPANLILDKAGKVRLLEPVSGTEDVGFAGAAHSPAAHPVDQTADIYSLGCTFYFLLTGREPFPRESDLKRLQSRSDQPPPPLRASRPAVSQAIEACYEKMMAQRHEDRPRSMSEVIDLLEAAKEDSSPIARRGEQEGSIISHVLTLEDPVTDMRLESPRRAAKPRTTRVAPRQRSASRGYRVLWGPGQIPLWALATTVLAVAALAIVVARRPVAVTDPAHFAPRSAPSASDAARTVEQSPETPTQLTRTTIFNGTTAALWMLCNRAPLPPQNIQADGLNPHGTGSYLVVYNRKLGDFLLDFDYKLTSGCNTGVFVRVSDLHDPIHTGIEIAIDDTRHDDAHDSGAFHGLVAPSAYVQKPSGQWNHMTITANGPRMSVSLNETEVSSIDLDKWMVRGKNPDGREHDFKDRRVAATARSGYLGFQDLGGNCWFKNIVLTTRVTEMRAGASSTSADAPREHGTP